MQQPLDILQQFWGYPSFRKGQDEIIQSILDGHDTLALLPTGGGKSICFQVPALCHEAGICIVVSPLIALMKDQVYNLNRRGIPAVALYSGMSYRDIDRLLDNCVFGAYRFLYLSPERLQTELAIERIKRMKVTMIAIDESHCISQWGYDFRPPYLQIPKLRELLPGVPVIALTATATPEVVEDIQVKLEFKPDKQVFVQDFSRDNLAYVVLQEEGKLAKLLDIVRKVPGSAVVYVRNRRKTREIAEYLMQYKISADFYHAGLNHELRSKKQDAWIKGETRIICSTNAFGMGIDKPDVRLVVHVDMPDNLEAYFQEAGRAGRDGLKSFAVLLYNQQDREELERQFELSYPELTEMRQVYRALGSFYQLASGGTSAESYDFDLVKFTQTYNLEPLKTLSCLKVLQQDGWLELSDAVFIPSSLQVICSKEQLYDYMLKNPKLETLLRTIMRSHQGIFKEPAQVRESKLAPFLKMTVPQLEQILKSLDKEGIVRYVPPKDAAQLVFLRARVPAEQLEIDMKRYQFLKERHLYRMQKAIAYAEKVDCRSRQLLQYFGQEDVVDCGKCDVCQGRHKTELDDVTFERIKKIIQAQLAISPLDAKALVQKFPASQEAFVLKTISYLLDENILGMDKQERLVWWG